MSHGGSDNLNHSYAAIAGSVPVARAAIAEFAHRAGASPEELDDIRLAASEALTNVVMHAYKTGPGHLQVSAALADGELWLLIGDDGSGLQTGSGSSGLGVGLALISEITDGFAVVNRSGGGTEVRMRFALARPMFPDEDAQSALSSVAAVSPASPSFSTTT